MTELKVFYDPLGFEVDRIGKKTKSLRNLPLHTDGSHRIRNYDVSMLHCWRSDKEAYGVTMLTSVDDVVSRLGATELRRLQEPAFPFHFGVAPVLTRREMGWRIRWDRGGVDYARQRLQIALAPEHEAAMEAMSLALASSFEHKSQLRIGDCLVFDNHTILHGRTRLSPDSRRLLKRIRLFTTLV